MFPKTQGKKYTCLLSFPLIKQAKKGGAGHPLHFYFTLGSQIKTEMESPDTSDLKK
jgi:hypothetical protein